MAVQEKSEDPFSALIKKFWAELVLIGFSVLIVIVALLVFVSAQQTEREKINFSSQSSSASNSAKIAPAKIFVDIAGAVVKPDLYEVSAGARLKDILVLAQGLSAEADRDFFAKTFNLSKILTDQEKIFIPSSAEIKKGQVVGAVAPAINDNKINLNKASISELEDLPGIGTKTAQKIIDNRPYVNIDDFVNKKIINKSVFEKTKDKIAVE